jgi:hypothetical protein
LAKQGQVPANLPLFLVGSLPAGHSGVPQSPEFLMVEWGRSRFATIAVPS